MNKIKAKKIPTRLSQSLALGGIKDTPAFPLALNVTMPKEHALDHANLNFRFYDFSCSSQGDIRTEEVSSNHEGYRKLHITLDQVDVKGRYAIEAVQTPVVDLDVGGTLMPFNSEFNRPKPAGADEGTGIFNDQQKTEYLDQARGTTYSPDGYAEWAADHGNLRLPRGSVYRDVPEQ